MMPMTDKVVLSLW